jgi:hypothetical protein
MAADRDLDRRAFPARERRDDIAWDLNPGCRPSTELDRRTKSHADQYVCPARTPAASRRVVYEMTASRSVSI